jgi:hypothetical protein
MADHGDLARYVCLGGLEVQMHPEQELVRLLVERLPRIVVGMDEKVLFGFEMPLAAAEKIVMLGGNIAKRAAVAVERGPAAALGPKHGRGGALHGLAEHDFVIAEQRNKRALAFEAEQTVDHLAAVGAAVDIVAEKDQGLALDLAAPLGVGLDLGEETREQIHAAVDVADSVDELALRQ